MPYAIPANIKYEERLVGPLTIKQSIYFFAGAMIGGFIYFSKSIQFIPTSLKLPLALLFVGLGAAFAFLNLEEFLTNYIGFMQSTKQSSWISPAARKLMGIRSIRADVLFLQDSRVLGVVKITPINFGVLSEQDKDTVIYGFLEFLNALNFPVQIVMQSVNLDLDDYLNNLQRRIKQRDDKLALAYYEHFAEYMRSYIKVNKINDRHFYVIVPGKKKLTEKETIDFLNSQCDAIIGRLGLSGISASRLDTRGLMNLYKSYFTDTFELYDSYISPITMYRKMWKESPKPMKDLRGGGQTEPPTKPQAPPTTGGK